MKILIHPKVSPNHEIAIPYVKAICIADPGPLELFAAGRTSGCVLSCGHEVSVACPVLDGHIMKVRAYLNALN